MKRALAVLAWLLGCSCAAAAPPLEIVHLPIGAPGAGPGPAAVWRPASGPPFVLQTWYSLGDASGTLRRHTLVLGLDGLATIAPDASWDAGQLLTEAPSPRKLVTRDSAGSTVPFAWPRLDSAWQAWLDAPAPGAPGDNLGQARAAWLGGAREREGQALRARQTLLGDTLRSTPLIVGAPAAFEQGAAYLAFRNRYKPRRLTAYLGNNDGMLHAFAADTGAELFAYIPTALGPRLSPLAAPGYLAQPFVDASAGQGDALLDGAWRTVLATGMGMGARGLFALDITDPEQFGAAATALWEFTSADDPAMGHLHAAPLVAKLRTGVRRRLPTYGHFVVVPSGINPVQEDGNGALFLLTAGKPTAQAWKEGVNYVRLPTTDADPDVPNALAPPVLALHPDGSALYAYAGDLQGRLWRFDLTKHTVHLLFAAADRDGLAQPISHAPVVVFAPGGGYLVLFATGKLIEQNDVLKPSFTTQSMYAILDRPDGQALPAPGRAQLARRSLEGKDSYTIKGAAIDYAGPQAKRGWYFDLPNARAEGERAAGSPLALGGAIMFDTVAPGTGPPPAIRSYVIDAISGWALDGAGLAAPDARTGAVIAGAPLLPMVLYNGPSTSSGRDATGGTVVTRTVTVLRGPLATRIKIAFPAGRVGWREVGNWKELHARTRGNR
ncbi:MAG TPA: PilC/PilY family type IV pilus protein [Telluria sp.]|jgi:type IV pilus assembly protein PilY1